MSTAKIALVTGGSRGLGKEMAIRLAKAGHDVIVTYRHHEEEARDTMQTIRQAGQKSAVLPLNMSDPLHREAFISKLQEILQTEFGRTHFDFLINNAGMGATVPFTEVTDAIFNEFMEVHFKGVYFLTQQCLPLLEDGGKIINISTGTTRFCLPGYSVYASMKGAIEVFTKYLAKELGPRRITANVIAPGPVETDFNKAAIRSNPKLKEMLGSLTPLGRVGYAEDIGGVVAFICSEDAQWINGQRIEVSGGIHI
jgi:NAD(P)-dependent dehydrogenase (short-subunit alcohol dehydrogenase family)